MAAAFCDQVHSSARIIICCLFRPFELWLTPYLRLASEETAVCLLCVARVSAAASGLPIQVACWVGWGRTDGGEAGRMLWRDCVISQLLPGGTFKAKCLAPCGEPRVSV